MKKWFKSLYSSISYSFSCSQKDTVYFWTRLFILYSILFLFWSIKIRLKSLNYSTSYSQMQWSISECDYSLYIQNWFYFPLWKSDSFIFLYILRSHPHPLKKLLSTSERFYSFIIKTDFELINENVIRIVASFNLRHSKTTTNFWKIIFVLLSNRLWFERWKCDSTLHILQSHALKVLYSILNATIHLYSKFILIDRWKMDSNLYIHRSHTLKML
jgi:hypothetical protein